MSGLYDEGKTRQAELPESRKAHCQLYANFSDSKAKRPKLAQSLEGKQGVFRGSVAPTKKATHVEEKNEKGDYLPERMWFVKVLRILPKVSAPGEFPGVVFDLKEATINIFGLMQYVRKDVTRTELKHNLWRLFQVSVATGFRKYAFSISVEYKEGWVPDASNVQLDRLLNNTPCYGDPKDQRLMYFSAKETCEQALLWGVLLHPDNRDTLFEVFINKIFSMECRNPWTQKIAPTTRYLFSGKGHVVPYCNIIRTLGTIERIEITLINNYGYPRGDAVTIWRG